MKDRFNLNLQAPLATIIAVGAGVLMLATYILPLEGVRTILLDVVVIGAAVALLIGMVNLLSVHVEKVGDGETPVSSIALILAMFLTFTITLLQSYTNLYPDWLPGSQWLLTNIQIPVESALMGVLAITLTYAAARLVSLRPNIFSAIFVFTLLLVLIASTSIGLESSFGQIIRTFVLHGIASAGARGILIGVALGVVATGLRIIMGSDRPYGG